MVEFMDIECIFSPSTTSNLVGLSNQGIYSVKPEDEITVTLSNGLSYKHIQPSERWTYKSAVAERVYELGLEAARICHNNSVPIMSIFSGWAQVQGQYDNKDLEDEFENEMENIAASIGYKLKKNTIEEKFRELRNILRYKDPKFLAARFAAICKDRSNIGQSAFFRLAAAGRGYIKAVEKVTFLKAHFIETPTEFLSFALLGRAPWTENKISREFQVKFSFARNFVSGVFNKFNSVLSKQSIELPEVCISSDEIVKGCRDLEHELNESIDQLKDKGRDTANVEGLLKQILKIKEDPSLLLDMFTQDDFKLSWKSFKAYANNIRGVSFSALRKVLIRACYHQEVWGHALEGCYRLFTPENTLRRPFSERVPLRPQPIELIMGSKYVIYRPGNAAKMTEMIKRDHELWFEIPKVSINGKKQKVSVRWVAQTAIYKAIKSGAKIKMFRFNMPKGPGKKIVVDAIITGPEKHLVRKKHLNKEPPHKKEIKYSFSGITKKKRVLGLDNNRLSDYVLAGPFELYFGEWIEKELNNWKNLEGTIAHYQSLEDTSKHWKNKLKRRTEKQSHQKRRSNLRTACLEKARTHIGKVLKTLKVKYVGIEADLGRDTKDKLKALAKAITSMPDNISLLSREILALNLKTKRNIKLVIVRKEGTTKFHFGCGGVIKKDGDIGTCKKCGVTMIHHFNAADNITDRSINIIDLFEESDS